MKVDFIDSNHFVIYYRGEEYLKTEEGMKIFFKMLSRQLKKKYHYEFDGFYNVFIYCQDSMMVFTFENEGNEEDSFGQKDFDITMFVNSVLLYEFEDSELIPGNKIFYQGKYYVELENSLCDDCIFEYGNIIYGDKVEKILNCGLIVNI